MSRYENGILVFYNLDISGCDGSHSHQFFMIYHMLFPQFQFPLTELLAQLSSPIEIRSLVSKKKVTLCPHCCKLYSGSTCTTCTNNIATALIGYVCCDSESPVKAAALVGYKITEDLFQEFSMVQFLKRSPVLFGDRHVPMLNLGVYLRASGCKKGDYIGRGDLSVRANMYQVALVKCMFPHYCPAAFKTLRQGVTDEKVQASVDSDHYWSAEDKPLNEPFYVDDSAYMLRYSPYTADDLIELLSVKVGQKCRTLLSDHAFKVDYGYKTFCYSGDLENPE